MLTLEDYLEVIERKGSVRKAAMVLDMPSETIARKFRSLPKDDPLYKHYRYLVGNRGTNRRVSQVPVSTKDLEGYLLLIEREGSVRMAAQKLGVTVQAISCKFVRLHPSNPLYIRYKALGGKSGRKVGFRFGKKSSPSAT